MTKVTSAVVGDDLTSINFADNSVGQNHIKDNAVGTEQISNDSVTGAKIADNTITSDNLASSSVITSKIANNAVTTSKIADGSVTPSELATNAVTTVKIADLAVDSTKIATGGVTTSKIADLNVTGDKIANNTITNEKIVSATISSDKISSVANGDLLVGNNGSYTRLQKGSDNSVLMIDNSGVMMWGTSLIPTGVITDYMGSSAPTGWIFANGETIGSSSSSATGLKGDTAYDLFVLLWSSMTNSEAPVSGGRGSSASADWSANKTITLPDFRGRVGAGRDRMGSSDAKRINNVIASNNTLGATGGAQQITLDVTTIPKHEHKMFVQRVNGSESDIGPNSYVLEKALTYNESKYAMATRPGLSAPTLGKTSTVGGNSSSSLGQGAPHDNVQPTILVNKIIKL